VPDALVTANLDLAAMSLCPRAQVTFHPVRCLDPVAKTDESSSFSSLHPASPLTPVCSSVSSAGYGDAVDVRERDLKALVVGRSTPTRRAICCPRSPSCLRPGGTGISPDAACAWGGADNHDPAMPGG